MAAPIDTSKHASVEPAPESPTTVKPFEMDDDDVQETGVVSDGGAHPTATTSATAAPATTTAPAASDEAPPAKPPRPVTEQQKNEVMLKEAFPAIDAGVIKAVLIASGGRIDPAFNALLAMSDPDAVQNEPAEEAAPPQPPRPTGARAQMSQLEADELYARQLAEHYDNVSAYEGRTASRGPAGRSHRQAGLRPEEEYEREHSFIDDELPVIRDNLRKGFMETQTKVTSWFNEMKKRIDGEYDSEEDESQPSKNQPHHRQQQPARRSGEGSRRSNDYDRYDADPQVLSDDFAGIKLNPDGTPGRPGAHGIYRPPPKSVSPRPDNRRVAFKEGVEDIDVYNASPKLPPKDSTPSPAAGKPSKWQPMSAVDPNPIAEHDPFSLGDSEDEKDTKDKTGPKEAKMDDNERLKKATADAMADSLMDDPTKKDEAAKKA